MTTLSPVYRDDTEGARVRYEELLAIWNARRSELAGPSDVHAIRTGRIWAGNAGILCAAALAIVTAMRFLGNGALAGVPTLIIPSAWVIMLLALLLGRAFARATLRAFVDPPPRTADVREDARRTEDAFAPDDLRERADVLERASVSRPMIAIALLAPLTIHLIVYGLVGQLRGLDGFDRWIGLSLVVVGHAHLTLAYLGWRFAKNAHALYRGDIARGAAGSGWSAYGYTVLASALPGAFLYLLPPILTAVTGLFIASPLFGAMTRALVRERHTLGVL